MILSNLSLSWGFLAPLVNHLWQSTLFVAAVWLLTLALKKNRAAVRYAMWFAASVKFLLPFSLLIGIGSRFSWRRVPAVAQPQWSAAIGRAAQPFAVTAPVPLPAPSLAAAPVSHPFPAMLILLSVWLCGFVACAALWLRSWFRVRAARRNATPLKLGLPIPAMSSPSLLEPGIFGIFRPVLLLPAGIRERLAPAQLDTIVAHEMCHVSRRDNLTAAVHMIVEAVFWFYPPVWWIKTPLMKERERACDEGVLELGANAQEYAEAILNVCKFCVESPLACVSGVTGSNLKERIVRILAQRAAEKLSAGRKVLLTCVAIATVAAPLAFGLLSAPPLHARTPQVIAPLPSVGNISIKSNNSEDPGNFIKIVPGRFTATAVTTKRLIAFAYDIKNAQLSGGPDWINSEKYDIDATLAKSSADIQERCTYALSTNETAAHSLCEAANMQLELTIQSLLADRFKLKVHHRTEVFPAYALVVAEGGPKFYPTALTTPSTGDASSAQTPSETLAFGPGELSATEVSMSRLADMLSGRSDLNGRKVLDQTGLKGKYGFNLQWSPEIPPAPIMLQRGGLPVVNVPPPVSSEPSVFTVLEQQLGLKLESTRAPVDVLVIDDIEPPLENQ